MVSPKGTKGLPRGCQWEVLWGLVCVNVCGCVYVGDDGGCGGRRCVYGSGDGSVMMGVWCWKLVVMV